MNRHIIFILDRTGSMMSVKDATISGFNEYLGNLKRDDPQATFQLTLFDDLSIDTAPAAKVDAVPELDGQTYQPRANTPLWDALGRTIKESQDNADTAYLVVTLTDGLENASKEWDRKKVADLMERKRQTGRWTFAYLGSNQDAWMEAAKFGYAAGSTMSYAATPSGTAAAMSAASHGTSGWSAANRGVVAQATNDSFLSGAKCSDCGRTLETGKTHACLKAVKS